MGGGLEGEEEERGGETGGEMEQREFTLSLRHCKNRAQGHNRRHSSFQSTWFFHRPTKIQATPRGSRLGDDGRFSAAG